MLNLTDTLHSSDARVERSIIFIDLVDSTGLKLNTPEASWLPHYGWFYEVCADRVPLAARERSSSSWATAS